MLIRFCCLKFRFQQKIFFLPLKLIRLISSVEGRKKISKNMRISIFKKTSYLGLFKRVFKVTMSTMKECKETANIYLESQCVYFFSLPILERRGLGWVARQKFFAEWIFVFGVPESQIEAHLRRLRGMESPLESYMSAWHQCRALIQSFHRHR